MKNLWKLIRCIQKTFSNNNKRNRIVLKGQIFSAKACLRIKLFSPQHCMKEYIIFELYLSQNIDQN